jgi:hypothetical protein
MGMKPLIAVFVFCIGTVLQAQTPVEVTYEGETKLAEIESDDPDIKDLVWHRWTTKNFTILSIDKQQGKYLAENVEGVKVWIMKRWGLPDLNFSAECRLLGVSDQELMEKLFRINKSMVEIRKESGKIKMSVGWLLLNDTPSKTVPPPLTKICLAEFAQKYNIDVGPWVQCGFAKLDRPPSSIKKDIVALGNLVNKDELMYFSKTLFTTKDLSKLSSEDRELFAKESMVLCLLLRREFGQKKLHQFMKRREPLLSLDELYGFKSYEEFDASLIRYIKDLSSDVVNNKTPDSYLVIKPAERE